MKAYSLLTDFQLLNLLKKDDEAAFAEIYDRYAQDLTGFASAKLYSLEDARDLIHDLFVKIWEERKTLAITANLQSYLFAFTRYRIIDKIRRNITREEYAAMVRSLIISHPPGADKQIEVKELQQTIKNSLDGLPQRAREIYKLSREENLGVREIAGRLGLSEQTVKNQLSTALKHIRQSLSGSATLAFIIWGIS
jgi:RNA polymerase sigma-70 factor (ECF subfamily)